MPLTGNEYRERSKAEILEFLRAELRNEFGEDIDLTESSVFNTFAESISTVDADAIEPALKEVHEAGFLETASGENLDRLVSILGISRRSATHATGTIEFSHESTAGQDYQIESGSTVQTDSNDPVQYETTELVHISLFDDFEDASLQSFYVGDTASAQLVDGSASDDPSPIEGSQILKMDATADQRIYDDSTQVERGSSMDFRIYLQDDGTSNATIGANMFAVVDNDDYYRVKIDTSGEHAIELITPNGVTTLQSNTGVTPPSDEWLRNEIEWDGQDGGRIISRLYDSNDNLVDEIETTNEDELAQGGFGFQSLDGNDNKYWDHSGERAVEADARAIEGGPIGNVGANTLTVMPTVPTGVERVRNPYPMGDDSFAQTDTVSFTVGREEEDDAELRDRASVSEGARGKGTIPALIAEASALPQAVSVSVYENDTDTDNTGSGGLPPYSFELVYFGADTDQDIAEMLFDVKGFTARDYGGAHGTAVSETIEAENGQQFTVEWSEPSELQIDMTLDIVVNDTFVGKDPLRDRIVDYIGGEASDGSSVLGLGTDEEVYIDQIEDIVTGPDDTGVIGISNTSFTPSTTTDSNGLEVIDVGGTEVAKTDATDNSITFNITRV